MSDRATARVGVRELRQNLSVYLDRVKHGEALDVTERGNVVARLGPPITSDDPLERLRATGHLQDPKAPFAELPEPTALDPGAPTLSEVLREQRDEERW